MIAACSEIALDLVENRIDFNVVKDTFKSSVGPFFVVNTLVATDWLWVRFDPVYRVVWETFAMDLLIGLAYRVETKVVKWARSLVRFPLITLSVLRVLVTRVYALHGTSLHFLFVSSRIGRKSISTSDYQHVRSVRRLVANCQHKPDTLMGYAQTTIVLPMFN